MGSRVLVILMVTLLSVSCANLTTKHKEMAQEYSKMVADEKELAIEFYLTRWQFYSGMLDLAIELYPNDIPQLIQTIKDKLDNIEVVEETGLTDRQVGTIWIARAFVLSKLFTEMIDRIIPIANLIM